jgi:hypothetical protein
MVFWLARGENPANPRRGCFRAVEWNVWIDVLGSATEIFGARLVIVCPD